MKTKANIAIIGGGFTSERQISLNSAKQVFNNIDINLFNKFILDFSKEGFFCIINEEKIKIDLNDFSIFVNNKKIKFDFAFLVIHGTPGEDGKIQGYLEMLNIPHSSCNVLCSAITYNKFFSKKILENNNNIILAKSIVISNNDCFSIDEIVKIIGLPCFVKPNTAGSSYGITKVYEKEKIINAINHARTEDNTVLIEEFIEGIEVSCGIIKTKQNSYIFPITEISTKNDYFDTEAKYQDKLTDEITPARISEKEAKKIQEITSLIYDLLQCSGIVRLDYIIKNGTPYFLELNSIPGMSAASIIPKQIKAAGKNISDILSEIINDKL